MLKEHIRKTASKEHMRMSILKQQDSIKKTDTCLSFSLSFSPPTSGDVGVTSASSTGDPFFGINQLKPPDVRDLSVWKVIQHLISDIANPRR
jgi:hypothetical protein